MQGLEGIIFDWAGTTVDYGCFAPVRAFCEVFAQFGLQVTMEEVRRPMGMLKWDHIKTMLMMPRIRGLWVEAFGREPADEYVDRLYQQFEPRLLSILDQYSRLKPHVAETVAKLREMGLKLGSTTGYTDGMMEIVTREAAKQGYRPDCWFSPDAVGSMGRPYPYMIYRNMETLRISAVDRVIKVGDTISDIREGINAGVKTVGILEGSSLVGLSEEEYTALSEEEQEAVLAKCRKQYLEAGANWVIRDIRALPGIVTGVLPEESRC